jgi:hypothetical protein
MTANQLYKLDFTQGLDLGQETGAGPSVTYLENFMFDRRGGVRPRWGYEPVYNYLGTTAAVVEGTSDPTASTTVEQTSLMVSYKNSVVRMGKQKLYSNGYNFRGMLPDMTADYDMLATSTNSLVEPQSISVTNAAGQVVRVVIFKTEVGFVNNNNLGNVDEKYTDQYRDNELTFQNTSGTWKIKNNLGNLRYSVYVDDSLIIDRADINALQSGMSNVLTTDVIGAQITRTKNWIVVVYARTPTEDLIGSGMIQASSKERIRAYANDLSLVTLNINNPAGGFINPTNVPFTFGPTPAEGELTDSKLDLRVQNVTKRIPTLCIDSSRTVVISAGQYVIPYKVVGTEDYANQIQVGDKLVLKTSSSLTGNRVPLGYMKVYAVDRTAKTFTTDFLSGGSTTTSAYIASSQFNVDWEIHRIEFQHYYPMFVVAQCEDNSSTASLYGNRFLISYVCKDPTNSFVDNGYWLETKTIYINPTTGAYSSYETLGASLPRPKATAATTADASTKTYVSSLSLSCNISTQTIFSTWTAVAITLSASYGFSQQSFVMGMPLKTENASLPSQPSPRNIAVWPSANVLVRSMSSVGFVDNAYDRVGIVSTSLRTGITTVVNGEPIFDDNVYASPNGNDLEVHIQTAVVSSNQYILSTESRSIHKDMNARLASKPWMYNGSLYCALYVGKSSFYPSSDAASLVVYDLMQGPSRLVNDGQRPRVVCNVLPRQVFYQNAVGNGYPRYHTPLPEVETRSNGYRLVSTVSAQATTTGISSVVDVTLDTSSPRSCAELNGSLFISGGVPTAFDGTHIYELGSIQAPVIWHNIVNPNYVGQAVGTADWYYKAVFEWVDGNGNIYRSAPSDAIRLRMFENGSTSTTAARTSITNNPFKAQYRDVKISAQFDHSTLRSVFANKTFAKNPVKVVLYRTLKNSDTNFYRVNSMPVVVNLSNDTNYASGYDVDSTQTGTTDPPLALTFTDIYSDAEIASNELLYDLDGAVLENQSPPSARFVCTHKSRIWLGGTPDDTIWYSKKSEPFSEPGFNELLTIPSFEGGPVVAMASLDDYLVVFKESSVWIINGDGADATGNNSTLQEPTRVYDGNGCISAPSVTVVGDAVYWQSNDGIYRMRRGSNQPELISDKIREVAVDYLRRFNLKVVSATYTAPDNCIRFCFYGKVGASAYRYLVVYSLTYNTFVFYRYTSPSTIRIVASCEYNGIWYGVSDSNLLIRENRTVKYDAGSTNKYAANAVCTMRVMRLSEMGGFFRVNRVMVLTDRGLDFSSSRSVISLSLYPFPSVYDSYGNIISNGQSRKTPVISGPTSGSPDNLEFDVAVQKMSGFESQIVIYPTTDNVGKVEGTGDAVYLTGIVVYGAPMRGKARTFKDYSRNNT